MAIGNANTNANTNVKTNTKTKKAQPLRRKQFSLLKPKPRNFRISIQPNHDLRNLGCRQATKFAVANHTTLGAPVMTTKQLSFQSTNWKHRFAHGGSLRKRAKGRGARPLSSREPLHLVFKINKAKMRGGLRGFKSQKIIKFLFQKYA
ncbi:MAG: hypothetical protein ACK5WZ_05215, partial [Pseudobdellovibrionaceae bacterium]